MDGKKHALLLFTKAPLPGVTKTRLTGSRGGILTPVEAASFYQAMLLDVAEAGFLALEELNDKSKGGANGDLPDQYDFIVSCSPEADQYILEELFSTHGVWPSPITFINDRGKTFDEHFDDAFYQLFERGYQAVVSIGGDLPTIQVNHIIQAFEWLEYFETFSDRGGFVLAPCQECGVSLVGYTANTPIDATGVFYNINGISALDAYITKAAEQGVPFACLPPITDVDNLRDLAHITSMLKSIAYSSTFQPGLTLAWRTLEWIKEHPLKN